MTNINPATPSQEATPGSVPQNSNPAPVAAPAPANNGTQGNNQEGTVTIPLKEYRSLQRQDARARSFDTRLGLNKNRPPHQSAETLEGDPALIEKLGQETAGREAAERRALQAEVRSQVRDLLEKDEFKALPKSTKDLILKNPHMLSEAATLDEAMLDIEDFVRDQVIAMETAPVITPGTQPPAQQPAGHEAPPVVTPGTPAQVNAEGHEDTSKLSGPARSQASIRNAIRSAKGTQKVS